MGGRRKQHNIKVSQSGGSQRATYPSSRLLILRHFAAKFR
uniref:Uncharacterized protein n=1 Tax=Arundo donax TaxID=35708 RepID=A0A0A9F5R0_ARUDO